VLARCGTRFPLSLVAGAAVLARCGTKCPLSLVVWAPVPATLCRVGMCPRCPGGGGCLSGGKRSESSLCLDLLLADRNGSELLFLRPERERGNRSSCEEIP